MANRFNLGDLRAAIEAVNRDVMEERGNGEAPNSIVLARLKRDRTPLIDHFSPQLIDIALTKLLNDVCRKNAARSAYQQHDLFDGYRKIPASVTISRGVKKATEKLTVSEAESWLESHSNRVVNNGFDGFRDLVMECRKHTKSDDETIEQILKRVRGVRVPSPTLELTST